MSRATYLSLVTLFLCSLLSVEIEAISKSLGIFSKRIGATDDEDRSMQTTPHLSSTNADIYLVFRQSMLDYSVSQGLTILSSRVQQLNIPDIKQNVHVPLLGDFNVQLSNIKVLKLDVSTAQETSRLAILDGSFHLIVEGVSCSLSFSWSWEKLGIRDQGEGELNLNQGTIESVFRVTIPPISNVTSTSTSTSTSSSTSFSTKEEKMNQFKNEPDPSGHHPHLDVQTAQSFFQSVDVKIHSSSADWLYQAILGIFGSTISSKVNQGISNALSGDVPDAANRVLESLPTQMDVQGLPFTISFAYSIYTLAYVLVEGHGSAGLLSLPHSPTGGESCPVPSPSSSLPPASSSSIATDGHMTTLFVHDSVPSCLAWALYTSGGLKTTLVDGMVDGLRLTTDLLAQLIPQLPKSYPKQLIKVELEALKPPRVTFDETQGIGVAASYRMTIYVDNSTLGTPLVAQLEAEVVATASQLSWESTIVSSAVATHKLIQSSLPVPLDRWDQTVAWFIENYGGLYPMKKLFGMFVHAPEASLVSLMNSNGVTYDGGWWALSADVEIQPLP